MTPLVFANLAVAVAYRAGLFNIGVAGQMLVSGFLATIIVGYSGLDVYIAKPLLLVIGIIARGIISPNMSLASLSRCIMSTLSHVNLKM